MKRASASVLGAAALISMGWVATPMVLIRPFAAQTPAMLAVAYEMRGRGGAITLVLLVIGLAALVPLGRRLASPAGRILAGLSIAALAGCAFLSRHNYFEWIFRPLPNPEFVQAGEALEVAEDDLVLGVLIGAEARAYPVRAMAYHHLVNDEVAGEPIVATY